MLYYNMKIWHNLSNFAEILPFRPRDWKNNAIQGWKSVAKCILYTGCILYAVIYIDDLEGDI